MESKFLSIINRLISISKTHKINEKSGTLTWLRSRSYYKCRYGKTSLYTKISPMGDPNASVIPEIERWIEKGNKVRVAELLRIIRDFRKRKRFSQALQVSEWMHKNGICIFSPTEHAVQLDLIGRVHGSLSAETYFINLMDPDKTDKTYGSLLNCYVRQRQTEKALFHFQKMKEMGFVSSPLTYNDIMCLYVKLGDFEKIPGILTEMKENKVLPDNFSYRICMNSYGARSKIEGMEKVLQEMESQSHIIMDWNTYAVVANFYIKEGLPNKAIDALRKSEERLDEKDGLGYNHLISLYASLGDTSEVLRLWGLEKVNCKRHINRDYITMMTSLVKLGELRVAEKLLEEWDLSGNFYDFRVPNILIVGYFEKGLLSEAEKTLRDLMEKGKVTTPNSWDIVAGGYLGKGMMEKAFECMKVALSVHLNSNRWDPNRKVIAGILNWVGDKGGFEDVDAFVGSLRRVVPMDRKMYHALIKANIRDGKEVDGLLSRMRNDKIDEDDETKKILSTRV